jgi:hypothetical protein
MQEYNVGLVVEIPESRNATEKQIEEWIEYMTGFRSRISDENPLLGCELKSNWIEIDRH